MHHSLSQSLHGVAVGLLQQRNAVNIQKLIVRPQSFISGCRTAVYYTFNEDSQILGTTRLAFNANSQARLFRVVDWDVESQNFAMLPWEDCVFVRLVRTLKIYNKINICINIYCTQRKYEKKLVERC